MMSWVKDTFFGGAAEEAADKQVASFEKAMEYQREAADEAKNYVLNAFGPGYTDLMSGYQAAQDQIAEGLADTSSIYKQASQQAGNLMQQGTQGSINALLGRNAFQNQAPIDVEVPEPTPTIPTPPVGGFPPDSPIRAPGIGDPPGRPQFGLYGDTQSPAQKAGLQATETRQRPDAVQEAFGSNGRPIVSTQQAMRPQMATMGMKAGGLPQEAQRLAQSAGRIINEPGRVVMPGTGVPGSGSPQPIDSQQAIDNIPEATGINSRYLGGQSLTPMPTIQQPDVSGIGLSGAEQALSAGAQSAENAMTGGLQSAMGTAQRTASGQMEALGRGYGEAQSTVAGAGLQARQDLQQGFGQARSDINRTIGMTDRTYEQGINTLDQARDPALNKIAQGVQAATGRLDPYASAGQEALQREAAMSGALGAEAQQEAYNAFSESPAQKFARERQEQALLRNASATGGLRGGSTLTALQEQAAGIAAQQEQRYLENLRNLAGRGQQAAGTQAGFEQQGGMAQSDVIQNIAGQQAQLRGQQAGTQASLGSQLAGYGAQEGQALAGVAQNTGQSLAGLQTGLGEQQANVMGNVGGSIAQMQYGTGQNIAGLRSGIGSDIAQMRYGTGQQVAQQMGGLGQSLAQNQLNLGQQLGGLTSNANQNLANLFQSQGEQGLNARMQLAQILSNLATGQGSNLASLQGQIGGAAAGGITGQAAGAQGGIGTAAGLISAFSDANLKTDIQPIMSAGEINLYSWTWKDNDVIPKELHGTQDIGVIAQEVEQHYPDLVTTKDGYKAVYYGKLAEALSE